jgi:hypothetical protein
MAKRESRKGTKASSLQFPPVIFVRHGIDGEKVFLYAYENQFDSVERDEDSVATYQLIKVRKGRLVAEFRDFGGVKS